MVFLITYTENGVHKAFYSPWFDLKTDLKPELEMTVYDLVNNNFTQDGFEWFEIEKINY